jgi:hypothetical protein
MSNFSVIALSELDSVRASIRAELKNKSKTTNKKYRLRTFYLGPRPAFNKGASFYRPMTTLKSAAVGAKIAVYEVRRVADVYPDDSWFVGPYVWVREKYI